MNPTSNHGASLLGSSVLGEKTNTSGTFFRRDRKNGLARPQSNPKPTNPHGRLSECSVERSGLELELDLELPDKP